MFIWRIIVIVIKNQFFVVQIFILVQILHYFNNENCFLCVVGNQTSRTILTIKKLGSKIKCLQSSNVDRIHLKIKI